MPNPRYHDDPEWYERPGETVNLPVLSMPIRMFSPGLPGQRSKWDDITPDHRNLTAPMRVDPDTTLCGTCGKPAWKAIGVWPDVVYRCRYCVRAEARASRADAEANRGLAQSLPIEMLSNGKRRGQKPR